MEPSSRTTITGGTFEEGLYGTVTYSAGMLDISNYIAVTDVSVYNRILAL